MMKCPNCGMSHQDWCRFCSCCGTPLNRREKKGTHLVPILIMVALTILGLCIYYADTAAPAEVPAAVKSDTPWFTIRNGNLTFDKYVYDGPGELTVPETLEGQRVVWIDDRCFEDADTLTTVLLPDSVEHIGQYAFADCGSLRALDIPASVITIGINAFDGCDSLEALHIPGSVNYIGMDAFRDCPSLSYIFFDGTQADWRAVFGQELEGNVTVVCSDGSY